MLHTHTQTHTHIQRLFKGLSLSQLLTTCIVLIFMKRSSRRRPRRQLAAQLFAQSKEKGKKIKEEGGGGEEAQHQLAPLCIVWPRATHSKRLRISSEPPQQSSPKSFRYCQIARKFLRSHRPQGDTPALSLSTKCKLRPRLGPSRSQSRHDWPR